MTRPRRNPVAKKLAEKRRRAGPVKSKKDRERERENRKRDLRRMLDDERGDRG